MTATAVGRVRFRHERRCGSHDNCPVKYIAFVTKFEDHPFLPGLSQKDEPT
jgi:hypothetical protein